MFYLRNPKSKKETPIVIQYYLSSGSYFRYSTGYKIHPEDWDNGMPIKARGEKGKNLKYIESRLINISDRVNRAIQDADINGVLLTSDFIQGYLQAKEKLTRVTEAFDMFIETRTKTKSITNNTKIKYKQVKKLVEKYEKHSGSVLTFDKVTADFKQKFLEYSYNELGHVDNTVGRNIGHIRTIISWAKDQGIHHNEGYKALKRFTVEADRVTLTLDEVMILYNEKFKESRHTKARDIFLIGVFSGQRFSDYSVFDRSDLQEGFIIKRAQKTNETSIIPVDNNPYLKALLDKYDWNIPSISNQKLNEYIKEACEIAKINTSFKFHTSQGVEKTPVVKEKWELVSTHTARRTFITLALERGMTYKQVMKQTGIKKVETLLKYDHASKASIGEAIKKVFPYC